MRPDMLAQLMRDSLLSYCCGQWDGYRPATHHRAMARALESVERGEINRLIIAMPPRHGKSQLASEFFPAWYLGRNPDKYIITATYSQDLADDFGRKVRNQLQDEIYRCVFPQCRLADDSASARRFSTTARGTYYAVGVGSSITGRGAHLLLIDDPLKNRRDAESDVLRRSIKDWYTSTAYTRLMPGGAVIIIQTRWHDDDLSGWLQSEHAHEGWRILNLPAIDESGAALWPEQYPLETLRKIEQSIGERDFAALYQQRPICDGGNILKSQWWRVWPDDFKYPPVCEHVFVSWDTAYSTADRLNSSYSAYTKWGIFWHDIEQRHCIILLGRWAGRVDYPELREMALDVTKDVKPDAQLIEKKASGQSLVQDLRRAGVKVRTYQPDRDKISRAYAVQAMLQSGQVWVPNKPWANDFTSMVAKFPSGAPPCSDFTDTVTQALLYLRNGLWVTHPDDDYDSILDNVVDDDGINRQRKAAYG